MTINHSHALRAQFAFNQDLAGKIFRWSVFSITFGALFGVYAGSLLAVLK
jgi:hypothetical protein